jgi:hypothetical protein
MSNLDRRAELPRRRPNVALFDGKITGHGLVGDRRETCFGRRMGGSLRARERGLASAMA